VVSDIQRFRNAIAKHWDKPITPEIAAAIEAEAFAEPDKSIDLAQFQPHEYRGLVFRAERLHDIRPELHLLHVAHWAETERARHGLPLKPNYEYMEAAERRGELLQLTARKDGRRVGNMRVYLFEDLHSGTRGVREDTFFMLSEVRQGYAAIRFWQYTERCVLQLWDDFEVWTDTKILHDQAGNVIRDVGRLNEYLGYTHVANRYHKRISKE
jgi:hypothetical protein